MSDIISKGYKKWGEGKCIGYFKCDTCGELGIFWGPCAEFQISFIGFCKKKGINTWMRPAETADLMGAKLQGKLLPLDLWRKDTKHVARKSGEPFEGDLNAPRK